MGRGAEDIAIQGTADTERIEAPVTVRAYLICAFAAFGGIFFGYDTGKELTKLENVCKMNMSTNDAFL